ncbi:MAG TPA: hypothetical protein VKX17_28175 [Planctomycetota bacterium]|nr:hypothetical protein [Planctomycetota bacterium]
MHGECRAPGQIGYFEKSRFFGFGFIFLGALNVFSDNLGNGLWIAFIGWFLGSAATAEVRAAEFRGLLAGYKVAQAMSEHSAFVPVELTLQQLVDEHILVHGHRVLLVRHGSVFYRRSSFSIRVGLADAASFGFGRSLAFRRRRRGCGGFGQFRRQDHVVDRPF